jgi:hypothetical protein
MATAAMLFILASPGLATTNTNYGWVVLHWTAPGDDSLTGTAALYDLRCSPLPITSLNFVTTTYVPGLPPPSKAGTLESFTVTGLVPNTVYYFAIRTADASGNWSGMSNVISKVASSAVGVTPEGARITDLSHPWPNPANANVSLAASLAEPSNVEVEVFDLMGRHVRTLAKGAWPAGDATLSWDLRDDRGNRTPTGIYKVRARLGAREFVRSVVVVR